MERYWLRIPGLKWQEVTRDKFIEVEHAAGFYPKAGCGPLATAGFGTLTVEGKISKEKSHRKEL